MSTYKFVQRNPKTAQPEVVATYTYPAMIWSGADVTNIKSLVQSLGVNLNDESQLAKLPGLISGAYLWVIAQ